MTSVTLSATCIISNTLAVSSLSAFDSVRHDYLFQVLRQRGVSPRFVQAFQHLMLNATACLRVNGVMTS